MAENKKSFLLYCDYKEIFDTISDKNAADLIRHIFRYVNDENPISDNEAVNMLFITIKNQLKRDLIKYDGKRDKWSKAGLASAESKRLKRSTESTNVENVEHPSTFSTVTVTDTVTVNVTDTVKVNNKVIKTKNKQEDFDFDFMATSFSPAFIRFLDYRKKIHKEFKTQMSVEACYRNLIELSCNDPTVAESIVEQSIANQWQGLFELKEKNSAKKESYGKQQIGTKAGQQHPLAELDRVSNQLLQGLAGQDG